MLTLFNEKTSSIMGNASPSGENKPDHENGDDTILNKSLRRKSADGLIFFAGTDKAHVITEILEARGWSRTKDQSVTNFTIKWCLAHQVDWKQFQEGKQLINNIPGQLAFADKINLWYTIRDYLRNRRTLDGNHIQTFLPMTFVLDEENEVTDFLRIYRKQSRTWICKPRYSYAGRGIYVLAGNSDLNTIFKFKVGTNNRLEYEPRLPGYLMQEYISRPLLIKGRKFDIRVHWLVAWTKPLLVFYNHNASVVRLSLNLYREFDYDRATHLTNLSVQENHCRYAYAHESTGMTMNQLNHYFNQCFRPFHPRMCQDWVMTTMQERMQTIIRHVIRASKDKLTRGAGQFGFFGCDFLLDENFRIWLLEVNDNPGVGWGNPRVNTTTKPLFEETLNIVLECFDKYKKDQSLLPIQCLKDYQLIYNEDDDAERLLRDDNQVFTERLSIRYVIKQKSSRLSYRRTLPRVNTCQTITNRSTNVNTDDDNTNVDHNSNVVLPFINMTSPESPMIDITTPTTPLDYSITDIIPLTPPIVNLIPLTPPIIDPSPLPPPIMCKTPTSLFQSDTRPSIITNTPLSVSTVTTTLLNTIPNDNNDNLIETIESLKHEDDIELERLIKPKSAIPKSYITSPTLTTRTNSKLTRSTPKRTLSNTTPISIQRKKRIDLTPIIIDNRRYIYRKSLVPACTETTKNKDKLSKNKPMIPNEKQDKTETQTDLTDLLSSSSNVNLPEVYSPN